MLSLPALLLTAGWVVLVALILVLFGRTAGGAWSIAGGLARGVRSWADARREQLPTVSSTAAEVEEL
jgi:hypothetical protein